MQHRRFLANALSESLKVTDEFPFSGSRVPRCKRYHTARARHIAFCPGSLLNQKNGRDARTRNRLKWKSCDCESMTDLEKYLELERLDYASEVENRHGERHLKVKEAESDHARRGMLNSGGFFLALAKIRTGYRRDLSMARINIRRKYAAAAPELLTDDLLNRLQEEVERTIQVGFQAQQDDFQSRAARTGLALPPNALNRQSEVELVSETAAVRREIQKLRLQRGLGMIDKNHENRVVLHISNSTVAGLNLGSVVGDMNTTLTALQEQGSKEVAEALKILSEAIAEDIQLGDARRELLENVSALGEQAKLASEERKMGIVKAAYRYLSETIAIAGHSAVVWATWGPQIAAFFGLAANHPH